MAKMICVECGYSEDAHVQNGGKCPKDEALSEEGNRINVAGSPQEQARKALGLPKGWDEGFMDPTTCPPEESLRTRLTGKVPSGFVDVDGELANAEPGRSIMARVNPAAPIRALCTGAPGGTILVDGQGMEVPESGFKDLNASEVLAYISLDDSLSDEAEQCMSSAVYEDLTSLDEQAFRARIICWLPTGQRFVLTAVAEAKADPIAQQRYEALVQGYDKAAVEGEKRFGQ